GLDHVREFRRDIDVRLLERIAGGLARGAAAGIPQIEAAAVAALHERRAVAGGETVRVLHDGDRDLIDRPARAVVEHGGDDALLVDLDRVHDAEEGAVFRDLGRGVFAGELGDAGRGVHVADVQVQGLRAAVDGNRKDAAGDAGNR